MVNYKSDIAVKSCGWYDLFTAKVLYFVKTWFAVAFL